MARETDPALTRRWVSLGKKLAWNPASPPAERAEGVRWLRRAAARGNVNAMQNLGWLCLEDAGDLQRADAASWMRAARDAGAPHAGEQLFALEPPVAWPLWAILATALLALGFRGRDATTTTCPPLESRGFWLRLSAGWLTAWVLGLGGVGPLEVFGLRWEYLLYWAPLVGVYALDRRCRLKPVYHASIAFALTQFVFIAGRHHGWIAWHGIETRLAWWIAGQGILVGLIARRNARPVAIAAGLLLAGDLFVEGQLPVVTAAQVLGHTARIVAQTSLWAAAIACCQPPPRAC